MLQSTSVLDQDANLSSITASKRTDKSLQELAESLQIPESRYEAANRAFKSVASWLQREDSVLAARTPALSLQGSFRHGTTIKPVNDEDHYDVDLVCTCVYSKGEVTQKQFKELLGFELKAYAKRYGMQPPEEGKRCWTLTYADGAQFHLDCLPAIPDSQAARAIRLQHSFDLNHADSTLAITDRRHPHYDQLTELWLQSNPEGYAKWFLQRMDIAYRSRLEAIALTEGRKVTDIPYYRVRTPLQLCVQILKRHRDIYFENNPDIKPISIIITTLAAHAYENETQLSAALFSIVEKMADFIEEKSGVKWIGNPSHPIENFADRWQTDRIRQDAFYEWHEAVIADLMLLANCDSQENIDATIQSLFGAGVGRKITDARNTPINQKLNLFRRLKPKHRQSPPWSFKSNGTVKIHEAAATRKGFRGKRYKDGCASLTKETSLVFEASTSISRPFRVYWQVVNWGEEATRRGDLRGGFDDGGISRGNLTTREIALYTGHHTIECYIVKDDYLVARSGQFEVNVK